MNKVAIVDTVKYDESRVGADGYWAKRKTKYGWKLVKSDRSKVLDRTGLAVIKLEPNTGHNERRAKILTKRKSDV